MAATGTPTPNIGLRIPVGTDPASVDDINYNSNLIDTKLGPVGSDSVQDQIDTLNNSLTSYVNYVRVNYGGDSYFTYWKVGKIVCVDIWYNVADGTIPAWSAKLIGTLPSGFRPKTDFTKVRLISDREASDAVIAAVNAQGEIRITTKYKPFEASGSIASGMLVFPTTE